MKVKISNGPNVCYMSEEDEKKVFEMIDKYIEEKKGEQTMPMTMSRPMFFTEAKRQAEKEYTYEVDELDYEQKVNYKWRIFEFICRDVPLNTCHDVAINKLLERVDYIYEELTKI